MMITAILLCAFCLTACPNNFDENVDKSNENIIQLTLSNYKQYFNITKVKLGNNPYQTGGIVYFLEFSGASSLCIYKDVIINYSYRSRKIQT